MNGNAMVAEFKRDDPCVHACRASAHKGNEPSECEVNLADNVEWSQYTVDEMVPRVRDVLTKGIVEYGPLGFLSEGRIQIGVALECAERLSDIHHEPFIVGLTVYDATGTLLSDLRHASGIRHSPDDIMVTPLSERDRFVEQAACVVTGHECWSLPDKLPDTREYRHWGIDVPDSLEDTIVSDLRSIRLLDPAGIIYKSTLEHWRQER